MENSAAHQSWLKTYFYYCLRCLLSITVLSTSRDLFKLFHLIRSSYLPKCTIPRAFEQKPPSFQHQPGFETYGCDPIGTAPRSPRAFDDASLGGRDKRRSGQTEPWPQKWWSNSTFPGIPWCRDRSSRPRTKWTCPRPRWVLKRALEPFAEKARRS